MLAFDTKLQETAASNGVTAMPTFIFFRNKIKIDSQRGADPNALEEKIKKWYGSGDDTSSDLGVKGHVSVYQRFSRKSANWTEINRLNITNLHTCDQC